MSLPNRKNSLLNLTLRAAMALLLGATCAMGIGAAASADTIDDGGFEGFALGDPVGQAGWTSKDIVSYHATNFDIDIVDPSLVWTGGELGNRALRLSNAVTSNAFSNHLHTPSLTDEAGETEAQVSPLSGGTRQSRFSGSFDFASATKEYQPELAITLSPDRGDGARMSFFRITDQPDGLEVSIAYVVAGTADSFVSTVVATGLARDQVHHFEFSLDFVDGPGNDVLWTNVGGQCGSFAESGSWEDYHRFTTEGDPPHNTKTVDSLLIRISTKPSIPAVADALLGHGLLFDDMTLTSSTVPPMPPLGTPGAPVAPSAQANATTVAVTGSPIITNACAPVTTYTVTAWPTGGGTPATFTSPTPTFSFPAPFDGDFTLTMSATNSEGTSEDADVDLQFDPIIPEEPPICGLPGAPVTPSAHVSSTSVAVTGTPVTTDPCPPVTTYTVKAWPLGGGTPATFTSPTPTFSFPAPFDGAFTLTMSATNTLGTSTDAPVSLTFDPVVPDETPVCGAPGAPVSPSARVNSTSVAVTGTPVTTDPCPPVTTYTVKAWPLGGGTPATFTSPTPTFSFPAPFDGAFTLTMSATNSQGTSTDTRVSLTFDPVFAGDAASAELATTGTDASILLVAATALVVFGAIAVGARRRRTGRVGTTPSRPL